MPRFALALAMALAATPALAAPRVVATIAPVHSLVAQVMAGVGTPGLLIQPGVSEHDYALRPSEAALLEQSEIVFRVGAGLERGLGEALGTLAGRATIIALADAPGVEPLPIRSGALFEAHDHDHGDHAKGEDHAHDHDHDHDAAAKTDDHGHDHAAKPGTQADLVQSATAMTEPAGHDDHDHAAGEVDPHLWLDPVNARAWLDAIATALGQADAANAAAYRANADQAKAALTRLQDELTAQLTPLQGRPFIVFHDAYHYFEHRFAIEAAGAVALNDATLPGAQRLAQIRDRLTQAGAVCVFAEPQLPADLVATVSQGTGARTGMLDPLGADLTPGPDLYAALLRSLADSLAGCLG